MEKQQLKYELNYNSHIYLFLEDADIDSRTITSCPKRYSDNEIAICYICRCGKQVERTIRTFKKRPLCDLCEPPKKRGKRPPPIENFIYLLEKKGYKFSNLESAKLQYVCTKSLVDVIDSSGKPCKISYNKIYMGHGSKNVANQAMKIPIKEVKSRVEEAGFIWVKNTKYVNNHTPFTIKCHCGNICKVKLEHLHKNRIGCQKCVRYNRKYPWSYIEGVADKYGCTLISSGDEYKGRDTIIEIFCACGEEMIKNVRCFLKTPRCSSCSLEKREITNIEKYGNRCYFSSDLGKETIKNYYMENFGVEHNMQLKQTQIKSRKTCLENFGVECVLSTENVRKKAVSAHIQKWGAPPGCVKEIRNKAKETNKEKYGQEYIFHSDHYKKAMMEKFGCEHSTQNPDLLEKAQKSAFSLKEHEMDSGKIVKVQGYEPVCLRLLQDGVLFYQIEEKYIVLGAKNVPIVEYFFDAKKRRYFMDMYLSNLDCGIEVKSRWTYQRDIEKNRAKWIAASLACKEFVVYVFDEKKLLFGYSLFQGEVVSKSTFEYNKHRGEYIEECFPIDDWED